MISLLPDPAIIMDSESRVFSYNNLMSSILGEVPSGTPLAEYIGFDNQDFISEIMKANDDPSEANFDRLINLRGLDGSLIVMRCRLGVKKERQDFMLMLLTYALDDQNIEHLHQEVNWRYQNLLGVLSSVCFTYRHDHNQPFSEVSDAVIDIIGCWPSQFGDNFTLNLTDSPVNNRIKDWFNKGMLWESNRFPREFNVELRVSDTTIKHLRLVETPIFDSGQIAWIEGVAIEVSTRALIGSDDQN